MATTPPPAPVPPPPKARGCSCWGCVTAFSLLVNAALVVVVLSLTVWSGDDSEGTLEEYHFAGDRSADDKVAIVRVSGMLMDGSTGFVRSQVEQAAKDDDVKAVVVRIESPGGTITASDEIHRMLVELRDNSHKRFSGTGPKPLVASMGNIAASGGYYIAMPASKVVAEPTTITGSIGVFAALPNVAELASKNGVRMELIRAGDIKAGGSPFQTLRPDERQPWQDMVDQAYDRFLWVIETGRPALTKHKLVNEKITSIAKVYDENGLPKLAPNGDPLTRPHTRYRADGGTFTPKQALELGLIDEIADIHTAIQHAANAAQLSAYRTIAYRKEPTWTESLLGFQVAQPHHPLSSESLADAAAPRLWFLTLGFEMSGSLSKP